MRVEPVTTSGPVIGWIRMSTTSSVSLGGGEHATSAVAAGSVRACSSARRTYGVVPDAAMPTTKSPRANTVRLEIFHRALDAILGAFLRSRERLVSAGDDALHHLGIGAVRRRTLGRVEHAESSGGSSADVEEPSAGAERPLGLLDRAGDRHALRRDRIGDGVILGAQQIDDLERRREVDVGAAWDCAAR